MHAVVSGRVVREDGVVEEGEPVLRFSSGVVPRVRAEAARAVVPLGFVANVNVLGPARAGSCVVRRGGVREVLEEWRCRGCGGVMSVYGGAGMEGWTCVICGKVNGLPSAVIRDDAAFTALNDNFKTYDVVDLYEQPVEGDSETCMYAMMLVVDGNLSADAFRQLVDSVLKLSEDLAEEPCLVGLLTFTNTVTVYDLRASGFSKGLVLSGLSSPSDEDVDAACSFSTDEGPLCWMSEAKQVQFSLSTFLSGEASDVKSKAPGEKPSHEKCRCLGTAVELAVRMMKKIGATIEKCFASRVVVVTGGHPDIGPGAIELIGNALPEKNLSKETDAFYHSIHEMALDSLVSIDLFCTGLLSFGIPLLRRLTEANGGVMVYVSELTREYFERDLRNLISRSMGHSGHLEVRCSRGIKINRIIGPVTSETQTNTVKTKGLFSTSLRQAGVFCDEATSFYFELEDDILNDYVYFQVVYTFIDTTQSSVARFCTYRIPVTRSIQEYYASLDLDTVSVLIAKRSIILAVTSHQRQTEAVCADLDEQVRDMASMLGKRSRLPNGRQTFVVSPDLREMFQRLYHLRFGALLGPILQHPDDIFILRCQFLRSDIYDALRFMQPIVTCLDDDGNPYELPLINLVLESYRILLLDCQNALYVWSGEDVASPEYEQQRAALVEYGAGISSERFPSPEIFEFVEGSSGERWVTCRLAPAHKDSPEEQYEAWPELQSLSSEELQELCSKFMPTDDPSFYQWYHGLFT